MLFCQSGLLAYCHYVYSYEEKLRETDIKGAH